MTVDGVGGKQAGRRGRVLRADGKGGTQSTFGYRYVNTCSHYIRPPRFTHLANPVEQLRDR